VDCELALQRYLKSMSGEPGVIGVAIVMLLRALVTS